MFMRWPYYNSSLEAFLKNSCMHNVLYIPDETWLYYILYIYLKRRYEAQAAKPPATIHSEIGSRRIVWGHIAARSLVHLNITVPEKILFKIQNFTLIEQLWIYFLNCSKTPGAKQFPINYTKSNYNVVLIVTITDKLYQIQV